MGSAIVAELTAAGFADAEEIWPRRIRHGLSVYPVALDRVVAVKVLTAELDEARERFLREQRAMGRLTRLEAKRRTPADWRRRTDDTEEVAEPADASSGNAEA